MPPEPDTAEYNHRVAAENRLFHENTVVLDLPPIYHYWSNKWIMPKLQAFGIFSVVEMFERYLSEHCQRTKTRPLKFVSIGAGNCEMEVDLAARLRRKGLEHFSIECLELNPAMLARAEGDAQRAGVAQHLIFIAADINQWRAPGAYDVVMASHSLHHVVNLEGLFAQIRAALTPGGQFVVCDVIGRNGHRRWPEALEIVREFWSELPSSYRYNRQLKRQEDQFEDWDCSTEGFEGIRAQDILPLLLKTFHFEFFVAFGAAILPFVDRSFGPNFDAAREWDQDFIDRVHLRDHAGMLTGHIKPTLMCAVLGTDFTMPTQYLAPLSPEFCVRWPDGADRRVEPPSPLEADLQTARRRIAQAANSKWLKLGRFLGLGPELR